MQKVRLAISSVQSSLYLSKLHPDGPSSELEQAYRELVRVGLDRAEARQAARILITDEPLTFEQEQLLNDIGRRMATQQRRGMP